MITDNVMLTKPWYLSRTVWVNLVTLVLGLAGYLSGNDFIAQNPGLVAALISAQGVLNVILRLITVGPVK